MKKTLVVGLAIGLVSLASAAFAGPSTPTTPPDPGYTGQKNTGGAGIVGSSHDLSNVGGTTASETSANFAGLDAGVAGDKQSRICVYCHHPHNARIQGSSEGPTGDEMEYSPLWNRQMSDRNFTGYNNGIMMGTADSQQQHMLNASTPGNGGTAIGGVSLLCMSCHDGVVAMNAYSSNNADGGTGSSNVLNAAGSAISGTAAFTTNLNNHHPMGFSYVAVQADDNEIAATDVEMVPGMGVNIGDLLYGADNTMECVTCHDVHNTANQEGAERFLWRSNNESNFCLTCHLK